MIRIINLRVAVTVKSDIKDIVEKKYPQLRDAIETIHVVRRAVDARKKPNIVFVYTLFVEVHNEAQIMKKLSKTKGCICIYSRRSRAYRLWECAISTSSRSYGLWSSRYVSRILPCP